MITILKPIFKLIFKLYFKWVNFLLVPVFLRSFLFNEDVGKEYGVRFLTKLRLFFRIRRIVKKIKSATAWYEHIIMAETILQIPSSLEGSLVECGCFKGASTASLSLVCALTGRKLVVFDSFQGLPEPAEGAHHCPHIAEIHTYARGDFRGGLEEVKRNVKEYGCLEVCEFIPGYFEETLPEFPKGYTEKVVFAFLDVDLRQSLQTCLSSLWGLLHDNCSLYCHEAHHLEIASLFFDKEWWRRHLGSPAPGLIGAGCGLSFNAYFRSALGYTTKGFSR